MCGCGVFGSVAVAKDDDMNLWFMWRVVPLKLKRVDDAYSIVDRDEEC